MRLLVVQGSEDLGRIWGRFLGARGFAATLATNVPAAFSAISAVDFDALILDPMIGGWGLTVADYATFRTPDIQILVVTRSSFFSDSAILQMVPNARGVLHEPVRPEDLAAYLEHFDQRSAARARPVTPPRDDPDDVAPPSPPKALPG